jgi:hypothetical protein
MLAISRDSSRSVASGVIAEAPSIQPTQTELAANAPAGKPLKATVPPNVPAARADELAE